MSSVRPPPARPRRPNFWGWLYLCFAIDRMRQHNKAGADQKIIAVADRFRASWKGNAKFYGRLSGAHWGVNHWQETIRFGRMALAIEPAQAQTVVFMLAAYREINPTRGIAFGERWLLRHAVRADVCRHLSFLYDDLGRRAEALAIARRGFEAQPRDRRLAACIANYLAKVEGAASALRFAEANRSLLASDAYAQNTLADGLSSGGAYVESEKIFAALHRQYPSEAKYLGSLLDARSHLGRYGEVLAAVVDWERRNPMNGQLANEAGRACVELGRGEEAMAWLKRAVELSPSAFKYADNYAISLGRVGRYSEGIEACQGRLASGASADRRRLLTSLAVDHTCLGQHETAMTFYRQAFAEFPDNDEVLINVIVGLTWLNRYAEAIEFGQLHRASRGPSLPVRYWSELAWSFHQTGRFFDEEKAAQEWGRLHPHHPDVARAMKRALNSQGRPDDALTFLRTWVDANPNVAWGWRYLAEQYAVSNDADAEIAALTTAAALAPTDADFASELLASLRRLKRSAEAFEIGAAWVARHPDAASADLLNRIGLAADDLERWPSAEDFYRRAHLAEPAAGIWFGNLLRALISQDRAPDAVALGQQWLAQNPWDNYVAAKLAWALRSAQRLDDETEILRQALQTEPADADLLHALLTSLIAQKRTDEAGALIERCHAAGTASARLHNDWANHLSDLQRFPEAEAAYHQSLVIAPDYEVAAGNLASLQVRSERAGDAIRFCREWLTRRPNDHYVRRQLANACYTIDEIAEAETEYRLLVTLEPDSAFLFGRLTACRRLQEKYEDALTTSTEWLARHTGSGFLLVEMGIAAQRLGQLDTALRHFEAALELDPASCAAALRKMRVLAEQGRLVLAYEFGEQWSAQHPDAADADFQNDLGILLDRAGRTEGAQRRFLQAAECDPNNSTFAGNAVEILARRGQLAESIQLGQRHLANSPPNAYLLRRLAESYSARHEHLPALDLLSAADALAPTDPDIALAFLRIAQQADELDRGIEFGRAWLGRPGNERQAGVWVRCARICFHADYDDEAFAALDHAAEIEPDEIAHTRVRFAFWSALHDSNRLVQEYPKVRPEWSDDPQLLRQVSRGYRELGLDDEALRLATRNAEANPADEEACAWLADLHDQIGRTNEAHTLLFQWINLHGEQPAVLKIRARLALHEKAYQQTLSDAEKVLHHDDSDEECFILSIRALRALGRAPEARSRLHHWIEHQDSSSKITRLLDEQRDGEA